MNSFHYPFLLHFASFHPFASRQLYREFRKPLIIPATKSLLRDKAAVSSLADFGPGTRFKRVYAEQFAVQDGLVEDQEMRKVMGCGGRCGGADGAGGSGDSYHTTRQFNLPPQSVVVAS